MSEPDRNASLRPQIRRVHLRLADEIGVAILRGEFGGIVHVDDRAVDEDIVIAVEEDGLAFLQFAPAFALIDRPFGRRHHAAPSLNDMLNLS